MKLSQLTVLLTVFLIACSKGEEEDGSCNGSSTRRDVKIAIDPAAMEIDTIPTITTLDSIGGMDVGVEEADKDMGRQEIEKKVFTVTGLVHKVSHHRDGDYKVKLISHNEKYLNCEIPNLGCEYIGASRFIDEMTEARAFIALHNEDLEGKTVTITGVAFIDIDHKYPRNAAENEIELHPILDISF
jgi:hypothetical protein